MRSQLRADNFSPSSTYLPGPLHEPPNATGVALHFTIRAPLLVQKEAESPQILGGTRVLHPITYSLLNLSAVFLTCIFLDVP